MPAFTRWRLPRPRLRTSNCSLLLIYLSRKDERLSRPGWMTYSGRFTHISGHPSVERRTGKVRRSKTNVLPPCHATNQSPYCCMMVCCSACARNGLILLTVERWHYKPTCQHWQYSATCELCWWSRRRRQISPCYVPERKNGTDSDVRRPSGKPARLRRFHATHVGCQYR